MVTHADVRAAMSAARSYLSQINAGGEDANTRYEALLLLAHGHIELGEPEEAYPYLQWLVPLARERGDRDSELRALCGIGHVLLDARQQPPRALPIWEEALVLARELGNGLAEAECLGNIGSTLLEMAQPLQALHAIQGALAILRKQGEEDAESLELNKLGRAHAELGQGEQALVCYDRSLVLARHTGNRHREAVLLGNMGHTHTTLLAQPEEGIRYFRQARSLFRALGDRKMEAQSFNNLAQAQVDAGRPSAALVTLKQARSIAIDLDDDDLLQQALGKMSVVYAQLGRVDDAVYFYRRQHTLLPAEEALAEHEQGLLAARERGDRSGQARLLGQVANDWLALGDLPRALDYNRQALALFQSTSDRCGMGRCLVNIGTALSLVKPARRGRRVRCLAFWRAGRDLLAGGGLAEKELIERTFDEAEGRWGAPAFDKARLASESLYSALVALAGDGGEKALALVEQVIGPKQGSREGGTPPALPSGELAEAGGESRRPPPMSNTPVPPAIFRQQGRVVFGDVELQQRFLRLMDDPTDFVFTGEEEEDASWYEKE
jgi:tetratricopeptide (TPR) repeat protein